jgi:hypothetical protein
MTIKPSSISDADIDFVPHAILAKPVSYFEDRLGEFERHSDDLDFYDGATFSLEGEYPFALRHYDGYPPDTVTIYLDRNIRDISKISNLIQRIVWELDVPQGEIMWHRAQDLATYAGV